MSVLTIDQAQFADKVLKANRPVVVEFFKYKAGGVENASKRMSTVVDEWASSEHGADFFRLSLAENLAIAEKYAVQSAPTLLIFSGGEQVEELIGYYDIDRPKTLLARHL